MIYKSLQYQSCLLKMLSYTIRYMQTVVVDVVLPENLPNDQPTELCNATDGEQYTVYIYCAYRVLTNHSVH